MRRFLSNHFVYYTLLFLIASPVKAFDPIADFDAGEYSSAAAAGSGIVAGTYLISVMDQGNLVFGGLYGMLALYSFNEYYRQAEQLEELVVPLSLVTMSALNVLLFRDESYSEGDIFTANIVGITAIGAYLWWGRQDHRHGRAQNHLWQILPKVSEKEAGIFLVSRF